MSLQLGTEVWAGGSWEPSVCSGTQELDTDKVTRRRCALGVGGQRPDGEEGPWEKSAGAGWGHWVSVWKLIPCFGMTSGFQLSPRVLQGVLTCRWSLPGCPRTEGQ